MDSDNLKILIVSAPRTGNTWLKYLLSVCYELPVVEFPVPNFWEKFDPVQYDDFGPRWIAHQHFAPIEGFVRWARERGIVLVTTVRHPAATLLSFYHYIENFAGKTQIDPQAVALLRGEDIDKDAAASAEVFEQRLQQYLQTKFFKTLNFSIAWLQSNLSYGVRYEDLWNSPVDTLRALTDQIFPVQAERIERAVEKGRIDEMRKAVGQDAAFFRGTGIDGWKKALPDAVIKKLGSLPPYPAQMKWLGYDLPRPSTESNEIGEYEESRSTTLRAQLGVLRSYVVKHRDGPWEENRNFESLFDCLPWWTAPSANCLASQPITPLITNLGEYLYRHRLDLQRSFPDIYGTDRVGFNHWYTETARLLDVHLDRRFVLPVIESWVAGLPPRFSPVHLPAVPRAACAI